MLNPFGSSRRRGPPLSTNSARNRTTLNAWPAFFVASFMLGIPVNAAEPPRRPNVVLVVADDLGWADLGCYGSKYHRTPHLDRFAASGMRFTDAYAACPVCSPTRAALMTGLYPARLNLTDWLPGRPDRPDQMSRRPDISQRLPAGTPTLPGELKKAGYVTGLIGKWHLGGAGSAPIDHGFDVNIAGDHTGTCLSYFAPFKDRNGRFMPGLENAPDGQYLTDRLTDEALKFIEANKAKPFFLYLPHYAPHTPMRAKPETIAKYKAGKHGEQGHPVYAAMLESLDENVGRLLKKLDDLKLADNTIVIFTSDNGGLATLEGMPAAPTFNGPLREGKGYLYEGGIRVPLIVRIPGMTKAGTTTGEIVCSIDVMPTILEACGVKSDARVDGVSIVPALKGGELEGRSLYWHYPHYANQGGRPGGAVRIGKLKLIEHYEDGRRELFDLKEDPRESRNLINELVAPAKTLPSLLDAWRKKLGARMPTPNPNYLPNPQAADGSITLPARTARIHGVQLRFEPLPHKNTLGFWVRAEDWASFEFTVSKPGKFAVEVLQGCGQGQGGSDVVLIVGEQQVTFTVEDTGHFQNFKSRLVGEVTIAQLGRHTLEVRATKKAKAAVMDLREVKLTAR